MMTVRVIVNSLIKGLAQKKLQRMSNNVVEYCRKPLLNMKILCYQFIKMATQVLSEKDHMPHLPLNH